MPMNENATSSPQPRQVHCKKLGTVAEGLLEAPLFGALGQEVFEHTSKEAWDEWSEMQLKIVNEYHLDLSEKAHRKTLEKQLRAFLCLDGSEGDKPEVLSVGTPDDESESSRNDKPTS